MPEPAFNGICRCQCGEVEILVKKPPITRLNCHCPVCQEVYGKAFSDMTLAWNSSFVLEDVSKIQFKKQRSFPIAVQCGTCKSCKQPVAGLSTLLSLFKISLIPSYMYPHQAELPESAGHIFYQSRVCDVQDTLPKYQTFVSSQLAVARFVISALSTSR